MKTNVLDVVQDINYFKEELRKMTKKSIKLYASDLKRCVPATETEQIMLGSALEMLCDDMPAKMNDEGVLMVAVVEYNRFLKGAEYFKVCEELKRVYEYE